MPVAAVARIVGESAHRVLAVWRRYVALAQQAAEFGQVEALAIEQTARRGHDYITAAAAALLRRVSWVAEGRAAATLETIPVTHPNFKRALSPSAHLRSKAEVTAHPEPAQRLASMA